MGVKTLLVKAGGYYISECWPHIPRVTQTVIKQSSQRLRGVRPHLLHSRLEVTTANHEQNLKI